MSDSKHTPGPWRVTRADGLPNAIVAPDEALGSVGIAKLVIPNDHEANARLIAAAPELLAALIEAADFIQPFNRAEALFAKLESVIAKATA